jgi:hypothetical protein
MEFVSEHDIEKRISNAITRIRTQNQLAASHLDVSCVTVGGVV